MTDAAARGAATRPWHEKRYIRHVALDRCLLPQVEVGDMKNEQERFRNLRRLPGVIDADEASVLLGITPADISVLVSKSIFKPLCVKLAPNAFRRFSSALVKKLSRDPNEWAECINSFPDTGVFVAGPTSPS